MSNVVLDDELGMTLVSGGPAPAPKEWLPRPPVRLNPASGALTRPAMAPPGKSGVFQVATLTALEESGFDPQLLDRFRTACRARGEPGRRVLERLVRSWLILELAEGGTP